MKRTCLFLLLLFSITFGIKAMSFEMAREQALYLTDKMAYELNLNDQQYEDAYEINLDYLLSLNSPDDLYGDYLNYRCSDFRHILHDWQWELFRVADYFLRPVMWRGGRWFYPIYSIYERGHFFYAQPRVYLHYHGGHGRIHYHEGFYVNRRSGWTGGMRGNMMDGIKHQPGRNGVRSNFTPGREFNARDGRFVQRGVQNSAISPRRNDTGNSFNRSSTRITSNAHQQPQGSISQQSSRRSQYSENTRSYNQNLEQRHFQTTRDGRNNNSRSAHESRATQQNHQQRSDRGHR